MTKVKTTIGRRAFLQTSALAGGGMVLGFSWLAACVSDPAQAMEMPDEWFDINGFLKIGDNGVVTIYAPNPEFGQNVKTSLPMIVAEELDIDWNQVLVEQAAFNTAIYTRQMAGGSQSVRQGWQGLRMAGAGARYMLREAAAQAWSVPIEEVATSAGVLLHEPSGKSAGYGEMASAASAIQVPEEVELKSVEDFSIIGTPRKNVDGEQIVTGKAGFGIDYKRDGMLTAMIIHPPAFGLKLKSFDDTAARAMPGIVDVFKIETFAPDDVRAGFDVDAFPELVAVVGNSTWEVWNAKKAITAEWEPISDRTEQREAWGNKFSVFIPAGLESSTDHMARMEEMASKPANVLRKDGDPEAAFKDAVKVVERTYTAPFLAHNSMEPLNFFAHVTPAKVDVAGPLQAPESLEQTLSKRLDVPVEKIEIEMTRMGGGFGRRAYAHYGVEAALISQKVNAPVKLMYSREDDMTFGTYRPSYHAVYRAGLDKDNNVIAFHVKAGGIPEGPIGWAASRFPAGAIDNYLAEEWALDSNITIGAFRAPRSNFIACAEQSFLDELAETAGKDPIEFRLELLDRTIANPVGERNDYDAERYRKVLELVRDKSGWGNTSPNVHRGVAAYFCHNSYAAHVLDLEMENGKPIVKKVTSAVDCGIVVNPLAATNMVEGAVVDGIGNALYGSMTFNEGVPKHSNLSTYRQIRHSEAPKQIDVHFVKNDVDPTGLGEPPFPPIFGAMANALYKATGKRHYHQPFLGDRSLVG